MPLILIVSAALFAGGCAIRFPIRLSGKEPVLSIPKTYDDFKCPPDAQNAICSVPPMKNSHTYVPPIPIVGARQAFLDSVKDAMLKKLSGSSGTTLIKATPQYLRFACETKFWGFVDDLEFMVFDTDPTNLHIRSRSRLGRKDFGVNRHRVEELRAALNKDGRN